MGGFFLLLQSKYDIERSGYKQLNCVIRQFIGKEINSCGKTGSIKHFQESMINCSEE